MLWKELIRLISVEGQPTKAVVAQKCVGIFFFIKCLMQFLQCFFLQNRLRTIWRTAEDHGLLKTVLDEPPC
jgi:hypothetical protein